MYFVNSTKAKRNFLHIILHMIVFEIRHHRLAKGIPYARNKTAVLNKPPSRIESLTAKLWVILLLLKKFQTHGYKSRLTYKSIKGDLQKCLLTVNCESNIFRCKLKRISINLDKMKNFLVIDQK